MHKIIGYLALLEFAGLLGFIIIARYQEESLVRLLPLLLALIAVVSIIYWKARLLSYMEFVYISVVVSTILIVIVQFLGFADVFPGLVKGVKFFSIDNAVRLLMALVIGTISHFFLLTIVRITKRKAL